MGIALRDRMKRKSRAVAVGSSVYVALPPDWLAENAVHPGDLLEVHYTDAEVVVRPLRIGTIEAVNP